MYYSGHHLWGNSRPVHLDIYVMNSGPIVFRYINGLISVWNSNLSCLVFCFCSLAPTRKTSRVSILGFPRLYVALALTTGESYLSCAIVNIDSNKWTPLYFLVAWILFAFQQTPYSVPYTQLPTVIEKGRNTSIFMGLISLCLNKVWWQPSKEVFTSIVGVGPRINTSQQTGFCKVDEGLHKLESTCQANRCAKASSYPLPL